MSEVYDVDDVFLEDVAANPGIPPQNNYSLEALVFMLNQQRVTSLEEKIKSEFKELRDRQNKVKFLHQLIKGINVATDEKGLFNASKNPELQKMFEEARALGVDIAKDKTAYNREERDHLIENIRMTCDDFNIQNEMQLQTVSRLTNERYESFQMARSILKPLHDAKINNARSISGR
jgi:hypothetical protein